MTILECLRIFLTDSVVSYFFWLTCIGGTIYVCLR